MEDMVDPPIIKERNIFTVVVNKFNQLLVEEKPLELTDYAMKQSNFWTMEAGLVKNMFILFGRPIRFFRQSRKAFISLKNDGDYKVYIAVQNELVAAYNVLRNREFKRLNLT